MAAVEEFCMAAKNKWPNVLIQFEDFPTDKAFDILDHMRDKVLCFNGEPSSSPFHCGQIHQRSALAFPPQTQQQQP